MVKTAKTPQIDITSEFTQVLTAVNTTGESLFITGKAGTGKSTLLRYLTQQTRKKYAVLAPAASLKWWKFPKG
jgi:ABC-type lipoprotein export system ATPase subunit